MSINKAKIKDEFNIYVVKDTPKTNSGNRVISIPYKVIDALPTKGIDGEEIIDISVDASDSRYKRMMASLGMKYRFHALRHSSIDYLANRIGIKPNKLYNFRYGSKPTIEIFSKVVSIFKDEFPQIIEASIFYLKFQLIIHYC